MYTYMYVYVYVYVYVFATLTSAGGAEGLHGLPKLLVAVSKGRLRVTLSTPGSPLKAPLKGI